MTLDSTGSLSFSELKSEYGVTTTSCSYSQLKRGGSFVDNSKNIELTDGISSVSYSATVYGGSAMSFPHLGYSERYMYGNLHTYSGGLGAGGNWAYGFMYNHQALNSVFNTRKINNSGSAYTGSNYLDVADHVLFHMATSASGHSADTEVLTATMGRAGTYYVLVVGALTLTIEVDTGSGFSTVYGPTATSNSPGYASVYTFNASVGHKIRFTLTVGGETISSYYMLSTSSTTDDRTLNVLLNQNVPTDATLSASGGISLSDFYDGENA